MGPCRLNAQPAITAVSGRPVAYRDVDQKSWINQAIAVGVPGYAAMLRWLTGVIIADNGSMPADDIRATLGRPTSFKAFAERNAATWTAQENK